MTIGQRIKSARLASEISQEELAKRCKWKGQSRVGNYERGVREPKSLDIKVIASALSVSRSWLATGEGAMKSEVGTISGNVVSITHRNGEPVALKQIPLISWTTAGDWGGVCDPYPVGAAEEWVQTTKNVSNKTYALRIRGDSMEPAIPDGATIVVDPERNVENGRIVIVKQRGGSEATCKRLIIDGDRKWLRPENPRYQIMALDDDALVCGVVVQVVMDLD